MSRPITLQITGDYNDRDVNRAIRDLKRLQKDTGVVGTQMQAFKSSFMGAFTGIGAAAGAGLAAMVGFQAVTQFLKDSAQAAIDDEKSMRSLAQAMTNVGLAGQLPEVEAGIDRLSRMYGIADDQLRPAFQRLATATESVTQSQKLLALALDISAGTGKDLESVTLALTKAAGGQTTALGRLGVGLDAALLKSKDMDAITAELSRKFGGQAAAAADTYGGKLARLTVAVDEAKEAIGYALLKAIDDVSASMGGTNGVISVIDTFGIRLAQAFTGAGIAANALIALTKNTTLLGYALKDTNLGLADLVWWFSVGGVAQALTLLGAWFGKDAADARGLTSATVQAAVAMGQAQGASRGLAGDLEFLDIKARSAADAFFILYGNASKFANVGKDSGLSRADRAERVAAGLALDPTDLLAENFRSSGGGGTAAAVEKITQAQQRILAAANKKLVDYNAKNAPFGEAAMAAAESFAANFEYGTGPFADKAKGLIDSALAAVRSKVTEAQQIGQQIADGLTGQLSLASALETAKATGGSIVDAFVDQGEKIKAFAENIKRLTSAGLSQEAVQEIVSAGYQRGAEIADAMISGNINENVRRANEVYTSVNNVAMQTGNQAAVAFGQTGINMALQMMQALIDALTGKKGQGYQALQDAMTALARSLYRQTYVDVITRNISGGGGGGSTATPEVMAPVATISGGVAGGSTAFPDVMGIPAPSPGNFYGGIPVFGSGGPVSAGRPYIVGDLGPELFVPSSSGTIIPNNALGGGNSYQITVQAGVGDPREIGRQVVEAIKSFERASGPVFVNA